MWGLLATAASFFVGVFRHIGKFFRLVAWDNSVSKREQNLAEEKRRLQYLVNLEQDNKSKIVNLVRVEVQHLNVCVGQPPCYVEVSFIVRNYSVFDIALVGLSSAVVYAGRKTGIEIPPYVGTLNIQHQSGHGFNREFSITDDFARQLKEKKESNQISTWLFPVSARFDWPFEPFEKEENIYWTGI